MLILEYFVTCFVKDEETTVTCFVKDEETTYIGRFLEDCVTISGIS